jgi:hypothetical protein
MQKLSINDIFGLAKEQKKQVKFSDSDLESNVIKVEKKKAFKRSKAEQKKKEDEI